MKGIILFVFCLFNITVYAQHWDWAITADSVYGNQTTKVICKSNSDLFALIYQKGPSIINHAYLDSGNVIVKINTNGQIQWAKNYPGNIQSIYAENNGNIYFIGVFSDTLKVHNDTLISHGSNDIFYGELDPAGNILWIKSAGSLFNDSGNGIIADAQGNIFIAGQFKDNYYVGNQIFTGNTGYYTYLLRCDLAGNYIASYRDSVYLDSSTWNYTPFNKGIGFEKDASGTIYTSVYYDQMSCNYVCDGYNIIKINSSNYTLTPVAHFSIFQYLHSWTINNDATIASNYNTQSHYGNSCDLFNVSATNQHTFRKAMGLWYDGKFTPCITKGIGDEIIVGGYFDMCYLYHNNPVDTLWYDNYFVIPDSLPAIMIGGINTSNQFTWLLRSYGMGASIIKSLISDEQGHCYSAGNYNIKPYYNSVHEDSLPHSITFGNTVLTAENKYTRFFVSGATTNLVTSAAENKTNLFDLSVYPNPSSGIFTFNLNNHKNTTLKLYDVIGNCISKRDCRQSVLQIDLSSQSRGIYFMEIVSDGERVVKKIVLQ